jgi:hypothetical protein
MSRDAAASRPRADPWHAGDPERLARLKRLVTAKDDDAAEDVA